MMMSDPSESGCPRQLKFIPGTRVEVIKTKAYELAYGIQFLKNDDQCKVELYLSNNMVFYYFCRAVAYSFTQHVRRWTSESILKLRKFGQYRTRSESMIRWYDLLVKQKLVLIRHELTIPEIFIQISEGNVEVWIRK